MPLFVGHDGVQPLERSEYLGWLRPLMQQQGIDPSSVTTHSHRRGGAQSLQSAGASIESIMEAGGWKSRAVMSYINPPSTTAPPAATPSVAPPVFSYSFNPPSSSSSAEASNTSRQRRQRARPSRHGAPMSDAEVAALMSSGRFDL